MTTGVLNGVRYTDERVDSDSSDHAEFGCYEDTARSVEIVREENKDGQLGSFGFTICQERPPRIGTIIPGGAADKAGLRKGDILLSINGEDTSQVSLKQVTSIMKSIKDHSVWLSVCEAEDCSGLNSTLGSSPQKSFFQSTPAILNSSHSPTSSLRRLHQLQTSTPQNSSTMEMYQQHRVGNKLRQSPPIRKGSTPVTEPNYVTLIPPQTYTVTRMSTLLLFCGPVKIPTSWSNRGVSSLCIQECARQLLSKRKPEDFIKVQFEVSQTTLRISNLNGNVLAKHRRRELFYCGSCTNDEQYFAIVSKTESDGQSGPVADLCHIFKLLPDSRLSTYVIDRSKSSREVRSGTPTMIKSCVEITEAIQSIFQSEARERQMEKTSSSDNLEYGIIRGISTLQLAGTTGNGEQQASPLLKRKKSNVVDLRSRKPSQPGIQNHSRNRSISNPIDPGSLISSQRMLHPSNSAGYISPNGGEAVHIRMHSDGITGGSNSSVRGRSNLLHSSLPREDAKRISDCSFSSMSSDHSGGNRSSTSRSGSPSSVPNKSQSPTPVPPPISNLSPHKPRLPSPRKYSAQSRSGAVSPCANNDGGLYGSKLQLRRQGSEGSVYDLTAALQMSPYHHLGMSNKGLSSSVDSIVTITTLAEDDVDLVVGRVAGWCGSFDKLLSDPLGLQYFLQFLETEHSEENLLFWKDIEEYKRMPLTSLINASKKIYEEYMESSAPYLINIDDITKKNVESKIDTPTATLFDEAQSEIYHLMKMDCYPRFQKSSVIKDSLVAEMEGLPLPIEEKVQPTQPAKQSQWGKKKLSLLDRIKGVGARDQSKALPLGDSPLIKPPTQAPPPSSTSFSSFSSLTQSFTKNGERRRSKKDKKAEVKKVKSLTDDSAEYHPEDNLKHLQAHKDNLFEVNLPNRVSKIIEAPQKATIREALLNVLKKYNYSLDVMEVRLTSTLQTVNIDSPASVLIGKHVSIMKSKHTLIATFPDMAEIILPADGTKSVRDLLDHVLYERGKTKPYSVFVHSARAPLELDMASSVLDGHTVSIKYLPETTTNSLTTSVPTGTSLSDGYGGIEELISKITRLSADTLSDQRTLQDDSIKTRRSPKIFKKPKKGTSSKDSSPKFIRTKSGNAVPNTNPAPIPITRSLSPPPNMTGSLPLRHYFPPPPASDPPNLSHSTLNKPMPVYGQWEPSTCHQHQRSGDAMSGISMGSGSSVDSITHELATDRRAANRVQLNQWVMQSQTSVASNYNGPNYFPTALGSVETLERTHLGAQPGTSLSRKQAAMMNAYLKQEPTLDGIVSDAHTQRMPNWNVHQPHMQQYREEYGNVGGSPNTPASSYPWRAAQHQKIRPVRSLENGSITSDSGQHFSDVSSVISSTCSSNSKGPGSNIRRGPPLSPTTHVLVVPDEMTQSSETYV